MRDPNGRVLILTSSRRDADSTEYVLSQSGITCLKCKDLEHLKNEIDQETGALVLAKEALTPELINNLTDFLNIQPTWSFLPIIMLIGAGDLSRGNEATLRILRPLQNTTFLERPVCIGTLVSVVQAALADRLRQYKVRDLLEALENSKQVAIAASQAKSDFLANMSHEIRSPLGAILGFSELLMEPSISTQEKQSYMSTIKRNGQLLSALIDDILDLSKVESGRIIIETMEMSLRELVSEVISILEPKALIKKLPLVVKCEPCVPRIIKTDPIRLKQILINVIGNAIKFTDRGQIFVRFFSPLADLNYPRKLHIEVTDTGLGISTYQAEKLFQPFAQADSSITRRFGGTGLGLVLSKRLAQALGGDLKLKGSTPQQGSTFEIIIDIGTSVESDFFLSDEYLPHSDEASAGSLPLEGHRVLLVDDSKDNQLLIGRLLQLSGAKVVTAGDGMEGMEKALSDHFDVVLMDIQMPKLGGHEATRQLREQGYSKPIIALTAHALQEDRQKCLAAGCDFYLTKPIQRTELVRAIVNYRPQFN